MTATANYILWITAFLCNAFGASAQSPTPRFVRTTGKLPQLAWSGGTDRLGSAKMGYIDTGIVLAVADTTGGLYKVKLAANRHAFLDKNYALPVVEDLLLKPVTAESWSVRGESGADLVSISLGRKVAYQSWMETNPSRIVLELYGVQANTNWITQLQSARAVEKVDYRQLEDDVVQVFIYLKHEQHYGQSIAYRGNQLQVRIRHLPARNNLRGKTVVVDAGHGGSNTGAKGGTSGVLEKEYTLLFARELQKQLQRRGVNVLMIREKDTAIDNKDRVLWSIARNPDLYISFHLNAAGRNTAKGTSTYYKHMAFSTLSGAILKRLLTIQGLSEFGHVGSFNFQPVQPTEYPSCLVEVAFLSNPEDEALILNEKFRKNVAKQVRLGIRDWFRKLR